MTRQKQQQQQQQRRPNELARLLGGWAVGKGGVGSEGGLTQTDRRENSGIENADIKLYYQC